MEAPLVENRLQGQHESGWGSPRGAPTLGKNCSSSGTEEFVYGATVEKQTWRTDLWTGERGGEGEM